MSVRDLRAGILDVPLAPTATALRTPSAPQEVPGAKGAKPKDGLHVVLSPILDVTPTGIFKHESPFHFQCPPLNQFQESGDFNFQDYETLSGGQHSQRIGRQLRTIQMDTIFVDWEPTWAVVGDGSGSYPAQRAVRHLCHIRDSGAPFRLVVRQLDRDNPECDYAATLRSVSWSLQAGEVDAYYVTVQFAEWVTPDINEYLTKKHRHLPVTLEIKKLPADRDTLHKLAKLYYGDPARARVIAVYNHITGIPFSEKLTEKNTRRKKITVPVIKKAKSK